MQVSTGVFLDQGFTAAGAIRLSGAVITGTLSCRGAKLNGHNNNDNALAADGMKVGGNVFLNQGFTADGTIRLSSADISGQLSCRGAKLNGQNNNS